MINGALKLKKYIILGREQIIHDSKDSNNDNRKLITEIYVLKPLDKEFDQFGQPVKSKRVWWEYHKYMYNEINTPTDRENGKIGRGRDINMESGQIFVSTDGTAQDFIDVNFGSTALETNNIRFIKTYSNQKFMKRDRETSFHKEYEIDVDKDGNPYMKRVDKNAPQPPAPKVKSDFSSIPAGSKYLYSRINKGTPEECICVTDVNYWLKNDAMNDQMLGTLSTSLDAVAPAGWGEIMENVIEPADGDWDALEKALQADPDWGNDVNFNQFCA